MFNKKQGVHLYLNIKNLMDVIREEEDKDDDLKRTLHRLQTYFVGQAKLINESKIGFVEKHTAGRTHVVIEFDEENDDFYKTMLELTVKLFIFNNKTFNNLSKYKDYPNFKAHAGLDFGDYYEYTINEYLDDEEFTTIGGVANNSAKIQSYAPKDYIYITKKLYDNLPSVYQDKFSELDDGEKSEFNEKIRSSRFFKTHYKDIFSDDELISLEEDLSKVKERVEDEANGLNLKSISFESCKNQLTFDGLSLKGKNKRLEEVCVICADIRGFTKLFHVSDQNLDDLKEVMELIYGIMNDVTIESLGSRVQYQGDRILSVYNDFKGSEDSILRMFKAALSLNTKIEELNSNLYVQEKLNNQKIFIGIGCSIGKVIATRLGLNGRKDKIILSDAYKYANKSEDNYAGAGEIVIWKKLKEAIDSKVENSDESEYQVIQDVLTAISTTGFYSFNITEEDFNDLVQQKNDLNESVNNVFKSSTLNNLTSRTPNVQVDPWSKSND